MAWRLLRRERGQEALTLTGLVREEVPLSKHSGLQHFVGNVAFKERTCFSWSY